MTDDLHQLSERIRKIENFCFTQNSDFQTKAFEDVLQRLESGNSMGIGKRLAADSDALFEVFSLTKGVRFPNMTTTQRDAIVGPKAGLLIFNVSTGVYNFHNGSAWGAI